MGLATLLFPAVSRLRNPTVSTTPGTARSDWLALGRGIFIRYERGDFRYTQGGRAFTFKIRNDNSQTAQLEIEVTLINEEGAETRNTEFYIVAPGEEPGEGTNWTIARDLVSFRMREFQLLPSSEPAVLMDRTW